MLLIVTLFSPLLMFLVAYSVVGLAKEANLQKTNAHYLKSLSCKFAAIGAGASLCLTIIWINWYEKNTGYSAGNGPLGWIFFYGPASAALGQLIALVVWWFKKPADTRKGKGDNFIY